MAFEARRQEAVLAEGGTLLQETRGWNDQKEVSFPMRVKESENDYRYFPDPDLVPMVFSDAYIEELRAALPELPLAKGRRYREVLGLSDYDAGVLTAEPLWAAWFESALALGGEPKAVCNWMNAEFARLLNEKGLAASDSKMTPAMLVELTKLVAEGTINGKTAKAVFAEAFESGESPKAIVERAGTTQISDRGPIEEAARAVLAENPQIVAKFKAGNVGVKGFLVGGVMKRTGGRANPALVQEVVAAELEKA